MSIIHPTEHGTFISNCRVIPYVRFDFRSVPHVLIHLNVKSTELSIRSCAFCRDYYAKGLDNESDRTETAQTNAFVLSACKTKKIMKYDEETMFYFCPACRPTACERLPDGKTWLVCQDKPDVFYDVDSVHGLNY